MNKSKYWNICCFLTIILCLITFTPLIIPVGVYKPMLFGIPYTLWTSFIITVLLVVLTYIGTIVHPGVHKNKEGDKL